MFFLVNDVYQPFSFPVTSQPVDGGQAAIFSQGQSGHQINKCNKNWLPKSDSPEMQFFLIGTGASSVATSFLFWPNMNKIPLIYWFHSTRTATDSRSGKHSFSSQRRSISFSSISTRNALKYSNILLANFTAFCGG